MSKAKFGDDIPHIVDLPSGLQEWRALGEPAFPMGDRGALGLVIASTRNGFVNSRRWEEVPKITYVPSERLKAMDRDEVDTHTFFPNIAGTTGQTFQRKGSPEFRLACVQAYNDWLAEEWTSYSPRFISQCIVPLWDAQLAATEIRRSVKNGHKGVVFHARPEVLGYQHFADRYWDPVYQECAELGTPLCLHTGAVPASLKVWDGYSPTTQTAIQHTGGISSQLQVLTNVMFSGVFTRFPNLKIVIVEGGVGWIPYLLELADHEYENLNVRAEGMEHRPSEVWRTNMYATFWYEKFGIQNRHSLGVETILYETDFPHATSTWPVSKQCREESLQAIPADERAKVLVWNAANLYHLDLDTSAVPGLSPDSTRRDLGAKTR